MTDWKSAAKRRMIAPLAVLAVGIAMLVVGGNETLGIIGSGVIAASVTIAIALVFLEIGLSEDRDRARRRGGGPDDV